MRKAISCIGILFMLMSTYELLGQINARLLRYPDVSDTHIAFVYAGDIWIVEKEGGVAHRLSTTKGEEKFPRFSPNGALIAFSGNYDGNTDIYIVPAVGGSLKRLTHHGMPDRILEWFPSGKTLLYASGMQSFKQDIHQLYRISVDGGMPQKVPVPYGEFGTLSPDGAMLAYIPSSMDFRSWKRYRGGLAPDIWLFNLKDNTAKKIIESQADDTQPMWRGHTLYFLSDRGPHLRHNIWAYQFETGQSRQLTHFEDFDVHFPAIGPSDIVFEAAGKLYLLNLETETTEEVRIEIITDRASTRPYAANVSRFIANTWISPHGKRVLIEARGEIFSVPAEQGVTQNLTMTSGVAERFPVWSPDGTYIAYWSDRSGEYELTVQYVADGNEEKIMTSYGPGFRYQPSISPDSKKIAFIDNSMTIYIFNMETKKTVKVDKGLRLEHSDLAYFKTDWSADSQWLTYSRDLENRNQAVFLFDVEKEKLHQVTSGFYDDYNPAFDPEGNYLFFLTAREFDPTFSDIDNTWVYINNLRIAAVSLRPDIPSPLAPGNEDEGAGHAAKKSEENTKHETEIVIKDFEKRLVLLPQSAGNYSGLQAVEGRILYQSLPLKGSQDGSKPLYYYDIQNKEEVTIIDQCDFYKLSVDHQKVLVGIGDKLSVIDLKPNQNTKPFLPTEGLEMIVDPRAEWEQIFSDSWRLNRDYFYDPGMHGVDWDAMRAKYGALIKECVTRWDVNYVLGELIGELNSSHTVQRGGEIESGPQQNVGYLGIDWKMDNGAYQIAKIIEGAPWDNEIRSPLALPGVDVKQGDYILAVDGKEIDVTKDPWAAFQGLAGKTIKLTVNDKPTMENARTIYVETMKDETRLRNLAWIELNRRRVEERTDAMAGYIYVPNTGWDGQNELVRLFGAQIHKKGLIIDERFNGGGNIPDRLIELLNRPPLAFWSMRDGKDLQFPPNAHFGPKVMVINGWSSSGGDAFPDYFKRAGLGPVIGETTFGGLIGVTGNPGLIDGGSVNVPTIRMYSPDGTWFQEGLGFEPDIEVEYDPSMYAKGIDPQLERAIDEILKLIKTRPFETPKRPKYENRTATKK